ncbi:hypothetical protein [Cupriavidus plantarum]|uniref:hypothetical protein n=1 Tax=Cupriavidus plantarum TaxID=942865 RepID=UPI000EB2940E|nr:hypothetical protein [Cupriavidus plantarum]
MNISLLVSRATPVREPVFTGEWATLLLRPDLGSQQDFVVGVAAVFRGDDRPLIKWLPAFGKLSALYGDALSSADIRDLIAGAEKVMADTARENFAKLATGTPHVRVVQCGYLATDDVEAELISLLKRQAGALWTDPLPRESPMDDDWAYMEMKRALASYTRDVFVPNRELTLGSRTLCIGIDSGKSYGNIVSARYSSMQTVERHIYKSIKDVIVAHKLTERRAALPALFVLLPDLAMPVDGLVARKTMQLLDDVQDMGVASFSDAKPTGLANQLRRWLA